MQIHPRKLYRCFSLGVLGLTALAVLMRTLSLCFFFDRSVGYVDKGFIPTLLYITLPLFVLMCLAYGFLASKSEKAERIAIAPDEAATTPFIRAASLLCAVTFTGVAVVELLVFGVDGIASVVRYPAAIIAALYFALPLQKRLLPAGLGVMAYAVSAVASEYFDWTVTLNSPIKLMQEASLMAATLFILVELGHVNHTRRSVRFTVCTALALFCGVTNGFSLVTAALAGGIVKPEYLLHALPPLAVGLYAAARLLACHEIAIPEPQEESEEEQAPAVPPEGEATLDNANAPTTTSQEEESNG